jgi:hypothetical protein
MYLKINNGTPVSYSISQLKADNPQVSFPTEIPEDILAEYSVFPVQATKPHTASETEVVESAGYLQLQDNTWIQAWRVRPMTEQELEQHAQQKDERRKSAYQNEADPLFFKAQRGEATHQEWLDKVAEIKARYP